MVDTVASMRNIAKKLLTTLLAIAISNNIFARNDTIKARLSPTTSTCDFNLIPANQGEPNIKYISKYIAINKDADFHITTTTIDVEIKENTYIEPAPQLASDYDSNIYEAIENPDIYTRDEFFPQDIITSERIPMRDFDLILIGVATEQYNPARRQTKSFKTIEFELCTEGGKICEIQEGNITDIARGIVINREFFDDIAPVSFSERHDGCNYLIVTPDNDGIRVWADTLKNFREEQGIMTKVVSLNDIGSNAPSKLKEYFRNAYDNWSPAPDAILLLGDYTTSGMSYGISSWPRTDHPEGAAYEPYLTDNQLVDFNNDDIPEIVIARMPAANAEEARLMVEKTLRYERLPSTEQSYYNNPVTAMGYEKSRWFQLCSEILAGYWELNGKQCVHVNSIHNGVPDSIWSTGLNTDRVVDYFGPEGLSYIPSTMSHLTEWNGNASDITREIENGSFMTVHRDHGTYETWGEPYYSTDLINTLKNEELTFVLSANCQTGHFGYGNEHHDCFAERFLRIRNGAVAIIAASELSFSYVNDTYVWGLFDYLYPDFMPDYGAQHIDFQYPAFANLFGKLFLKKSSFPANPDCVGITNRLFHYFGDAFLQLNSEVPNELSISHPNTITPGHKQVTINADDNTNIALSVNSKLIAKGKSSEGKVCLDFSPQKEGTVIKVVATKQNHRRHESYIKVSNNIGIEEIQETTLDIYPNPTKGELTISGDGICNIKIFNILGRKVRDVEFLGSDKVVIDISDLSDGIYLIMVNDIAMCKFHKSR